MRSLGRFVAALFVAGASLLATGAAWGQEPGEEEEPSGEELLAARELFDEGRALEKKEDWAGALAIMERVAQVKLTPNVRYHIAFCHEGLGRFVEAVNGYDLALQEAKVAGKSAATVLKLAPKRVADLRKQLGQIEIRVTGELRTSRVLIDGKDIARVLLGRAIPVDPGVHVVQLETGGAVVREFDLELGKGDLEVVELEVHDPEPVVPPPTPPPPPVPVPGPELPGDEGGSERVPAYVVGSLGLASLVASGVLWGLREDAIGEVRATCDANDAHCDPRLIETADLGYDYQNASFALLGVGVLALGTGVGLFFALAPPDPDAAAEPASEPSAEARLDLGLSPTGVSLRGSF